MSPKAINRLRRMAACLCILFMVSGWLAMLWSEAASWSDFPLNVTNTTLVTTNTSGYLQLLIDAIIERDNALKGLDTNTNTHVSITYDQVVFSGMVVGAVVTNIDSGFTNIWTNLLVGLATNTLTNTVGTNISMDLANQIDAAVVGLFSEVNIATPYQGRFWADHELMSTDGNFNAYFQTNSGNQIPLLTFSGRGGDAEVVLRLFGRGAKQAGTWHGWRLRHGQTQDYDLAEFQYTANSSFVASARSSYEDLAFTREWLGNPVSTVFPVQIYHATSASTNEASWPIVIDWDPGLGRAHVIITQSSASAVSASNIFSVFNPFFVTATTSNTWNRPGDSWTLSLPVGPSNNLYIPAFTKEPTHISVEWINETYEILNYLRVLARVNPLFGAEDTLTAVTHIQFDDSGLSSTYTNSISIAATNEVTNSHVGGKYAAWFFDGDEADFETERAVGIATASVNFIETGITNQDVWMYTKAGLPATRFIPAGSGGIDPMGDGTFDLTNANKWFSFSNFSVSASQTNIPVSIGDTDFSFPDFLPDPGISGFGPDQTLRTGYAHNAFILITLEPTFTHQNN